MKLNWRQKLSRDIHVLFNRRRCRLALEMKPKHLAMTQNIFKVENYLDIPYTAKASLDIDTLYDNAASVFDRYCSQDASSEYLKLGVIELLNLFANVIIKE